MNTLIKRLLRESLLITEDEPRIRDKEIPSQGNGNPEDKEGAKSKGMKDYSDVQNALDKSRNPTAPSQVGVMKAVGIHDDKKGINRSLFGKKLHQDVIDGVQYQFSDEELDAIRVQLGIK